MELENGRMGLSIELHSKRSAPENTKQPFGDNIISKTKNSRKTLVEEKEEYKRKAEKKPLRQKAGGVE